MRPASPDDSAALEMLSASAAPWYVAINGVPVGPIKLSELRKKAAAGLVTEASLCWQDGNEEWRPVKTFPELAQLVREASASGRPSLISSPPGERVSAVPPAPAARPGAPRAPAAPRSPATPPPRNNVVPIGARTPNPNATAEININEVELSDYVPPPASVPPNAPGGFGTASDPFGAPVRQSVAPDPFAAPAAVVAAPPGQVVFTPAGAAPVVAGAPAGDVSDGCGVAEHAARTSARAVNPAAKRPPRREPRCM